MVPKSSHSLRSLQCCICVNLVKRWPLVKMIQYRQTLLSQSDHGDLENKVYATEI